MTDKLIGLAHVDAIVSRNLGWVAAADGMVAPILAIRYSNARRRCCDGGFSNGVDRQLYYVNDRSRQKAMSTFYATYDWVNDNGYDNLADWVEDAAQDAGR